MDDFSSLLLIVSTSAVVNGVALQKAAKPVTPSILAHGLMLLGLAIFGGITGRYDFARALAVLFLISSLAFRGKALIDQATSLVGK